MNTAENSIQNIVNKIKIIQKIKGKNLANIAKDFDLDYQSFYRMMKGKHQTSHDSLCAIADRLQCSYSYIVSEYIKFDVDVIKSDNSIENVNKIKVFVTFEKFYPVCDHEFYAHLENNKFLVFYKVKNNITDGKYLVKRNKEYGMINVEAINSKFIFINENNDIIKEPITNIEFIGKLFISTQVNIFADVELETFCEIYKK